MAKAPTRSTGRWARTSDRHERELKRLLLSICDDTGFRLYLASYDQPKRRDELISGLLREAESKNVRVTKVDLADASPDTNLVGLLRAHLHETDLPPGWRQAVMVTGIEQRLDYSAGPKGFAFLHQSNLLRDALPEAAPVPVVLWLSRLASAALPAEAPDLWHWRAANFDFTGDEAPRLELLRELTTLRPEEKGGLSDEQRRARLRMLEELLAELEREGPPRTKRQKAERASLLYNLGFEEWQLGRATEAIPRYERAREIFRETGERWGEGAALGNLGIVYADLGEPERAIEFYEHALRIFREIGERRGEIAALTGVGLAYADLSEPQRALEHFDRSFAIAREIGDRQGEDIALGNLGNAYAELGERRRAVELYEQWLKVAREIGKRQREGIALRRLGDAYAALGEPRRAIEFYEQSLKTTREIGDRRGEGNALFNSALAFDQLGERAEAIRRMQEALAIFEQIENLNAARARAKLAEWRGEDGHA